MDQYIHQKIKGCWNLHFINTRIAREWLIMEQQVHPCFNLCVCAADWLDIYIYFSLNSKFVEFC